MKLDLRFSERPLEDLWCEAVVAFVFQRTFLMKGGLSGLDAKLGGMLGRLEQSGFWSARRGEDLLVASQGRIKADKVLLCGLGSAAEGGSSCLPEQAERVGGVLERLRVRDFAVHIPLLEGEETGYPEQLEAATRNLAAPYARSFLEAADPVLKVVFSIERFFLGSLAPLTGKLRTRLEPGFDLSVVVERESREAMGT